MSAETKKFVTEVQETFKRIQKQADEAGRKAAGFDKELATKIHRVKESAGQVAEHIEKKTDSQNA